MAEAKGHPDDPGQITIVSQITGVRGEVLGGTFAVGPDWAAITAIYSYLQTNMRYLVSMPGRLSFVRATLAP